MSDDKAIVERTAKRIRSVRRAKHLTQAEVAKRAGISETHYAQIERAEKNPSGSYLSKIIDALDVESKDILGK
jgi:transcriptional regulator with XRE-family HTH domain